MTVPSWVVTCCERPLARIDDDRPEGGLSVAGDNSAIVIASGIEIDGVQPYEMSYEQVAATWAETTVSETAWPDGHATWTIRCDKCRKQAQATDTTLRRLADALAHTRHEIPLGVLCRLVTATGC